MPYVALNREYLGDLRKIWGQFHERFVNRNSNSLENWFNVTQL